MIRKNIELQDGDVVEKGNCGQSIEFGARRAGAGVDEDLRRRDGALIAILRANDDCLRAAETCLPEDQLEVCSFLEPRLDAASKVLDNLALALANFPHLDADGTSVHAVVRAPARQVRDAPAGDHGLGRGASLIDAGAAYVFPFDESRAHSRTRESHGEW